MMSEEAKLELGFYNRYCFTSILKRSILTV